MIPSACKLAVCDKAMLDISFVSVCDEAMIGRLLLLLRKKIWSVSLILFDCRM